MFRTVCVLAGIASAAAAQAQTQDQRALAVTVYNQNFALIKDVRPLDLSSGVQTVRIDDVAASIDATSVHFKALNNPGSVAVLEQNFQYDLAGAERILDRYLNRPVQVVMNDGSVSAGDLLSYNGGSLVLSGSSGVAIVNRGEVRDIQLGDLPGGLVVKPTLVWSLASNQAGRERAEISYMTQNMSWHAEYVAVVNDDDTELDLSGWVSIDNRSGATYPDAKLKLVAGDVHRVQDRIAPMGERMHMKSMDLAEEAQFQENSLFEYHVYTLQRRATVADRETKQLSLFPSATTEAHKMFVFDGQRRPGDVAVELEFENRESAGLGMPLPAGKIRVFKKDRDGAMEFVGEDRIDHTPKDERLNIYLGNAFDIKGEHTRVNYRKISNTTHEETFEIELRNHKDEPVTVKVVEHRWGDWRIVRESHQHAKTDAHTMEYMVTVGANDTAKVTYTVVTVR